MTSSLPAEAYEWLFQVQTNLSPTILFPEASRLNVSKRIRHEAKLTGVLSYPLPTPPWGQPSKLIFQGQDFSVRFAMSLFIYLFLFRFCSLVPPCLGLLAAFPPLFLFYFLSVLQVRTRDVLRWKAGRRDGVEGEIKTQRQQWKVMCGDKTSQWCFCGELECLYYVLPPKRCLMSYPAGLWVVAETGLIDFLTLHNAGLCSIKHNHQMAVLGFRTFWRLPCLPWFICLGQIIMGQKRFRLRFREISSRLHNKMYLFIYYKLV